MTVEPAAHFNLIVAVLFDEFGFDTLAEAAGRTDNLKNVADEENWDFGEIAMDCSPEG